LAASPPPNRVRHPADRQFASSCLPPRLTTTQVPSTTGLWLTLTRTSTVLCARLRGRTGSAIHCANRSPTQQRWLFRQYLWHCSSDESGSHKRVPASNCYG